MDKEKIDLEVYDKCVDASVALFMQYYCAAVSEDIHKEILEMQAEEKVFPETLDTRCRATIKKQNALSKRRKCVKSVVKGLRYVAVFAVVLLALSSVLFVSVEAIRVPIINFYIKTTDKYLEIGTSSATIDDPTVELDWDDPLAGFLAEDYSLLICDGDPLIQMIAAYENSSGSVVKLSMVPLKSTSRIDTEGAQSVQNCIVASCEATMVVKDNVILLAWDCEITGKRYILKADALNEQEILDIAEGIMRQVTS